MQSESSAKNPNHLQRSNTFPVIVCKKASLMSKAKVTAAAKKCLKMSAACYLLVATKEDVKRNEHN